MTISTRTRMNWALDFSVFASAVVAGLSGIYFLYVPSGGYQGGRNIWYGVTILLERATWSDLHVWGGVAMLIAVLIHLLFHWNWVMSMSKKVIKALGGAGSSLSRGGRINLIVNLAIALSFTLTALSGVYFLIAPTGGYQGGMTTGWDPGFLMDRSSWDVLHTWSGVLLIVAAIEHFIIHWGWITKVTTRFFAPTAAKRSA